MKALLVKIDFFEAFFKVHRTKCARLTYPVPLPTSVAGMFGAMCGWERRMDGPPKEARGLLFGAKMLSFDGLNTESATYKESPKNVRGVAPLSVLNEPSYLISMAGHETIIDKWQQFLLKGFSYLPYGGQNDFFTRNISKIEIKTVKPSREIKNYAPKNLVKDVKLDRGAFLHILPVVHLFADAEEMFYFVGGGGKLILKDEIPSVEGIGLYPLSNFHWVLG